MQTRRWRESVPAKIFVLDEHPGGLAARKAILETQGHVVSATADVAEARAALASGAYEIVVVNHSGVGADLACLRQVAPAVGIVLLLDALEALGRTEQDTGADAIVPKDGNEIARLIRAVNRLLRLRRAKKSVDRHAPGPARRHNAASA
ncbi:MAG: DegT/DnrJ/EryC1/StrS family aminotransferase [Bryobacterales bacterium]|nr:response regulator [Bryobacteraceae bacterium]MDW8355523.1 DegT/DnrJ/EryC1/StrS family aminotransferase [Bryobacterales bacterium]